MPTHLLDLRERIVAAIRKVAERFRQYIAVTFENRTLNQVEVKIKSVTIRSNQNGEIINSLPESTLTLMPLEVSAQQYRLFSQQSYGKHQSLIGSLVYEVDATEQTLTSPAVQLP